MIYNYAKKVFFMFEPEIAHKIAGMGLKFASRCPLTFKYMVKRNFIDSPLLKQELFCTNLFITL